MSPPGHTGELVGARRREIAHTIIFFYLRIDFCGFSVEDGQIIKYKHLLNH
jgi:hypothetical protein